MVKKIKIRKKKASKDLSGGISWADKDNSDPIADFLAVTNNLMNINPLDSITRRDREFKFLVKEITGINWEDYLNGTNMKKFVAKDYEIADLVSGQAVTAFLRPSNVDVSEGDYILAELWAKKQDGTVVFPYSSVDRTISGENVFWRGPLAMPDEAARFKIRIKEVFMKRISLLNDNDYTAMCLRQEDVRTMWEMYYGGYNQDPVVKVIYFELIK